MRNLLFVILLAAVFPVSSGQNLIGYKHDEIIKYMRENHTDLNYNIVSNSKFSYMKYSDNSGSQTVLFFLDSDSVCASIRIICDERARSQKIKEFNSLYKSKGGNRWTESRQGVNYLIELNDEEWATVINLFPVK